MLSEDVLQRLMRGVGSNDGPTRPAEVSCLRDSARRSDIAITITEGRNRQIRRMIEAVGSKVVELVRTGIGPIGIGDLAVGAWRDLTPAELSALRQ